MTTTNDDVSNNDEVPKQVIVSPVAAATEGADEPSVDETPKRISVSLTGKAMEVVKELAVELDVSDGAVVRRALGLLDLILEEERKGNELLLQEPGRPARHIKIVQL